MSGTSRTRLEQDAPREADVLAFSEHERELLVQRWRRIVPLAMLVVAATEVAAWITPAFPKGLAYTLMMEAALLGVWWVVRRNPSRTALGFINVVATVCGAAFAASASILQGGFSSLHVMAMPCLLAFATALLAMSRREVIAIVLLSIGVWVGTILLAGPQPPNLHDMQISLIYLGALGLITIGWVSHNRRLRQLEFFARRRIEEVHRFAVEEVLCRHLSPRYVESVLAGEQLLDAPPARRCLTVVFADIVSFTSLSDALTPDELARAMTKFYDRTATIAFEHGATIDKFIGDAVMAILGAPEPLPPEEQARRALATARAWQAAVSDILPGSQRLRLRIGMHQDEVVVGSFGGRHRTDYTVLGLGVNIAARLEGACPPGSILMSDAIFAQLSPQPDARNMGTLELRGVPRPVLAFAVSGEH